MRIIIELQPPHWFVSAGPRRRPLLTLSLVVALLSWPLAALVYAAGIMRACTAGTPPNFCPNDPVLRAQQASQWDRALGLNGAITQGTYVQRAMTTDAAGFAVTTLDSANVVGLFTSIVIGADGLPLIS